MSLRKAGENCIVSNWIWHFIKQNNYRCWIFQREQIFKYHLRLFLQSFFFPPEFFKQGNLEELCKFIWMLKNHWVCISHVENLWLWPSWLYSLVKGCFVFKKWKFWISGQVHESTSQRKRFICLGEVVQYI